MSNSYDIATLPTSPSGKRMLARVSPVYENSYFMKWLMQVMGLEWDEVWEYVYTFREQIFTDTVTWAIEYQEYKYSLEPDPSLTLEERRARLRRRAARALPISPGNLEVWIEASYSIIAKINELYGPGIFQVIVKDDPLDSMIAMRNKLRDIKPSHLSMMFLTEAHMEESETENVHDEYGFTARANMEERYPWRGRFHNGMYTYTMGKRHNGLISHDGLHSYSWEGETVDAATRHNGTITRSGMARYRLDAHGSGIRHNSCEVDVLGLALRAGETETYSVIACHDGRLIRNGSHRYSRVGMIDGECSLEVRRIG